MHFLHTWHPSPNSKRAKVRSADLEKRLASSMKKTRTIPQDDDDASVLTQIRSSRSAADVKETASVEEDDIMAFEEGKAANTSKSKRMAFRLSMIVLSLTIYDAGPIETDPDDSVKKRRKADVRASFHFIYVLISAAQIGKDRAQPAQVKPPRKQVGELACRGLNVLLRCSNYSKNEKLYYISTRTEQMMERQTGICLPMQSITTDYLRFFCFVMCPLSFFCLSRSDADLLDLTALECSVIIKFLFLRFSKLVVLLPFSALF